MRYFILLSFVGFLFGMPLEIIILTLKYSLILSASIYLCYIVFLIGRKIEFIFDPSLKPSDIPKEEYNVIRMRKW